MLSFMLRVYTIYIKNAPHIRYRGTIKNVLGCLYRWCLLGGLFWFVFPNNLMAQYFYRKGLHCIQKLTVGFTRYIKKRYAIQRYNVMNSSAERSLPLMPTWRFDLFFPDNMLDVLLSKLYEYNRDFNDQRSLYEGNAWAISYKMILKDRKLDFRK